MSGIGKFKLSDALPQSAAATSDDATAGARFKGKGQIKPSGRSKKAKAGDPAKAATGELTAEQTREIREVTQAKNSGPSIRDHMVDIGRGNQQAGRQGTGGRRGK
ncbi:MAG: hypothetical protein P4L85_25620 [Paludisphaera borealis]|uniref:hypothetical protein n=1 Tax=Paludisphaera borealis TaxID=1387353 RepID=UPI0028459589|nr:hypothetical protein [Paludisphaera borealis]MDR3622758.1 hypothetical protein [Paludisphaera borealis]